MKFSFTSLYLGKMVENLFLLITGCYIYSNLIMYCKDPTVFLLTVKIFLVFVIICCASICHISLFGECKCCQTSSSCSRHRCSGLLQSLCKGCILCKISI